MARTMTCPNGHAWPAPTMFDPLDPAARGQCPTCGELVALDSPALTRSNGTGCFVAFAVIWVFLGLMVALIMSDVPDEAIQGIVLGAALGSGAVAVVVAMRLAKRRRERLRQLAEALGFAFQAKADEGRGKMLSIFPLFAGLDRVGRATNEMFGAYEGDAVYVIDSPRVVKPAHGKRVAQNQTVIAYLDAVPDLPEFEIEPSLIDKSKPWNRDVWTTLGFKKKPAVELGGDRYDVGADDTDAVAAFLEPRRDWLDRLDGWGVQSREGRLLFFRPNQLIDAALMPAFLAITWRFRRLLIEPARITP